MLLAASPGFRVVVAGAVVSPGGRWEGKSVARRAEQAWWCGGGAGGAWVGAGWECVGGGAAQSSAGFGRAFRLVGEKEGSRRRPRPEAEHAFFASHLTGGEAGARRREVGDWIWGG